MTETTTSDARVRDDVDAISDNCAAANAGRKPAKAANTDAAGLERKPARRLVRNRGDPGSDRGAAEAPEPAKPKAPTAPTQRAAAPALPPVKRREGFAPRPPEPRIAGHFQTQMRAQALAPQSAEPTTIDGLLEKLADYLAAADLDKVRRAYDFAKAAHSGQRRRTGHDYITHPLAVADILAAMRMDWQSIAAAVMHDVLEDSASTKAALAAEFGDEVADIVDGVSKLATIFQSRAEAQAENFQKMAMATARDLRVILVKLADRLHNMRTIGVMPAEARKRIARETLDFYAPIANRLGMNRVRVEFEELAFQALFPLRADRVRRAAGAVRRGRQARSRTLQEAMAASLRREGIDAAVQPHHSHLYSIYRKMRERRPFAEITAAFAFQVVVDQVDACYRALGVLHNLYKPVAGRFKDYIAIPKTNGYQSLHTALVGMDATPIEVQVRTRQMHALAEDGIAGHWLQNDEAVQGSRARARQWVAGLLDLQRRAGNSLEFIESLKMDLFPDEVYVFTPRGDIFELPGGACSVDFAYAVHTDVGNHCIGCRVNRALAPLSAPLASGQTVEIITSRYASPSPDWLSFTVSSRARSAIRQALKVQQRSESVRLGRRLLDRALANAGTSIKALDFRRLRRVFRQFGVRRLDDLLAEIGLGNLMAYSVAQRLLAVDNPAFEAVDLHHGGPVAIRGTEGLVISYGRCCGPVPGDPVVGHTTPGKGLVVHVEACHNVADPRRRHPEQLVPVRWAARTEGEFDTALAIKARQRKGTVAEIAAAVNAADAGIDNIVVDERSADLLSVRLELSVASRAHLARVRQRLLAVPAVQKAERPVR